MKKLFLFCLTSWFLVSNANTLWQEYPVDFYTDMAYSDFFETTFARQDPEWLFAKALYERGMHTEYSLSGSPKIPLIFHLIWLGSNVPESYQKLKSDLKRLHPQCEVKLWTDENIKTLPLTNQAAFDTAQNYGEKSDILRYELLESMGGVYLDGDFDVYKSLIDLFYACDFFCSLLYDRGCTVNNGVIGSCPHHPIMQQAIAAIKATSPTQTNRQPGSPDYLPIQQRTGPYMFTRYFLAHKDQSLVNVAFPVNFLQPLPYYDKQASPEKLKQYIQPHTLVVHRWAESWVTPQIKQEIQINISVQERMKARLNRSTASPVINSPSLGLLAQQMTEHDRDLIDHVKMSILNANMGLSKLTAPILAINGLSSPKVRHLLNNICTLPSATYLEVGPYFGATLIAALYGNSSTLKNATAIDNWSVWGDATRQAFLKNTAQYLPQDAFTLIELNCFYGRVLNQLKVPITVYFYGGQNEFESNVLAFTHFNSIFAPTFIAIINDWNCESVQQGTMKAFQALNYTILYEAALPAQNNGDVNEWWNGLYIAVINKN